MNETVVIVEDHHRLAERELRSQAIKAAQARPTYADQSFSGRGILRCAICGKPCRDHAIGPCPEWEGRQ